MVLQVYIYFFLPCLISHETVTIYGPAQFQGDVHQVQHGPGTMHGGGMQQQQNGAGTQQDHPGMYCDVSVTFHNIGITIEAYVAGYGRHYRFLVLYTSRVILLPHVYDALVDNTPRMHGPSLSRQN